MSARFAPLEPLCLSTGSYAVGPPSRWPVLLHFSRTSRCRRRHGRRVGPTQGARTNSDSCFPLKKVDPRWSACRLVDLGGGDPESLWEAGLLVTRNLQPSLWESVLPDEVRRMALLLELVDRWLDDEPFFAPFRGALQHRVRPAEHPDRGVPADDVPEVPLQARVRVAVPGGQRLDLVADLLPAQPRRAGAGSVDAVEDHRSVW